MTRKPCDDNFDREEKAFRKASEKLIGAAVVCVRQAGSDLARACRLFTDPEILTLGATITENLRNERNFDNVQNACRYFSSSRRATLNHRSPAPEDLIVISAIYLEDACQNLLSASVSDLPEVGPATVKSRSASDQVLKVFPLRT